jgi:hypothetical protein
VGRGVEGSERAELGNRRGKIGKERRRDGWGGGGGGPVFMVVEKSSEARLRAPSPIGWPLNPGGQTARLRLLNLIPLRDSDPSENYHEHRKIRFPGL